MSGMPIIEFSIMDKHSTFFIRITYFTFLYARQMISIIWLLNSSNPWVCWRIYSIYLDGDMFWLLHRYSLFSPHQTRSVTPIFYLPYVLHIISCISDRFFENIYGSVFSEEHVLLKIQAPLSIEKAEDEIHKIHDLAH